MPAERRGPVRRLEEAGPVWHALIWIGIYIVAVSVGDTVGAAVGFPGMTSIVLLVLSVVLLLYLRAGDRAAFYGIRRVRPGTGRSTLFFLPLFAVVMANANDQRHDGFTLPANAGAHELSAKDDED